MPIPHYPPSPSYDLVWCGMVWFGLVWYGVVVAAGFLLLLLLLLQHNRGSCGLRLEMPLVQGTTSTPAPVIGAMDFTVGAQRAR